MGKRNVERVSKIEMELGRRPGSIYRWPTTEVSVCMFRSGIGQTLLVEGPPGA
jgi:hypothetical protein